MNLNNNSSVLFLVDGLRPSSLGPYGNTWFDTNSINQLASESLLFEQCISDAPDVQQGIQGIFSGQHCCAPENGQSDLADVIGSTGIDSILITNNAERFVDCHDIFDQVIELATEEADELPTEVADTQAGVFFARTLEIVAQIEQPVFLVLDCPGFVDSWDAPYALRETLADPDDPAPGTEVAAPSFQYNPASDDPDVLLNYQVAYSAQVLMFDQLFGILLNQILDSEWGANALICLVGLRSYPLGEHGVVGFYRPVLGSESVHVPLLVRWPTEQRIFGRSHQLVQPGSLNLLLKKWHDANAAEVSAVSFPLIDEHTLLANKKNSAVISKSNFEGEEFFAFQTKSWKYVSGPNCQLFVKPDDIWDFNNVAELCPQITIDIHQQLLAGLVAIADGRHPEFELADALAFGIE